MIIELLDDLERAFGRAYKNSLSMRLVKISRNIAHGVVHKIFHVKDAKIIGRMAGYSEDCASYCIRWMLDLSSRVYEGSVCMDIIERAFLNSRWAQRRSSGS